MDTSSEKSQVNGDLTLKSPDTDSLLGSVSASSSAEISITERRQSVSISSSTTKRLSSASSSTGHNIMRNKTKLMDTIRLSLVVAASLTVVFGIFRPSLTYYGNDHTTVKSVYNLDVPTSSFSYQGSTVENYVLNNSEVLGYMQSDPRHNYKDIKSKRPRGCEIWKDDSRPDVYAPLQAFRRELKKYNKLVDKFQLPEGVTDLRNHLNDGICDKLQLDPGSNGLEGIFPSGVLSYQQNGHGYMEPLLPPLRDPQYCFERTRQHLLSLGYLVHDFAQLCSKLKRHSRIVLVDMGASLSFHKKDKKESLLSGNIDRSQPAIYLTSLYEKFGFVFDHIYAFEVKSQKPAEVFEQVPQNLMGAYHWINVGVSSEPGDKLNPLTMLLDKFDPEDDIIIVKLDIDTSSLEVPLAFQILNDPKLNKMINHFYFEHHVHLKELQGSWTSSMNGTVAESLQLFRNMRERGIASHYWV